MQTISIYAALSRAVSEGIIPPVADIHYAAQQSFPTHTVTTVTYASSEWWPKGPAGEAAPIMAQVSIVHELDTDELTIPHLEEW